ncbi:type IV pilus assembly protein PilY1 [Variovorax beijingensis]|uniref:Type IV pilus assembly protein PilY1 n=1 Tax=Variovorax beijingensis TaxID=2496117 RepID=A0A561CHI4_9BURK|nr:PilC/PilY family type IV pilus protein [Variovorax beijingensis]TWD90681.1 type IV pilus assembly protein PilY1 [Variovorax beijingensis]
MSHASFHRRWHAGSRRAFAVLLSSGMAVLACAVSMPATADTLILDEPLATRPNVKAKPNLLFILDNSGSMASAHMPDDMNSTGAFGYRSAQCNGVAYDPTLTYSPPIDSTGKAFDNASFASAWTDGFARSGGSDDLNDVSTNVGSITAASVTVGTGSKSFQFTDSSYTANMFAVGQTLRLTSGSGRNAKVLTGVVTAWTNSSTNWSQGTKTLVVNVTDSSGSGNATSWAIARLGSIYYVYKGSQPKMDWKYSSTAVIQNTFYTECHYAVTDSAGRALFAPVVVTSTSAEAQNYANWYSYYRTRRLLMRTATGKAMQALDSSYRVGFTTISNTGVVTNSGFQDVDDFGDTQKETFYSKLYAATGTSNTPLRGALSKAGRYFAKKMSGQTYDPMQYSCQRNYALLSTDGYWNTGSETTSYGPLQLDGSSEVGQQDGTEARPMKDAGTSNTLADVAAYYYNTDLRTTGLGNCKSSASGSEQDVCSNNIVPAGRDTATSQHMTTFTIGLGVNGTLDYDRNYLTQTSGSYVDLVNGAANWPAPDISDSGGEATNIDDLWHAAVNGRGQYYSALNATALAEAISGVVNTIQEVSGTSSAASTSALELVAGDNNQVYKASYTTKKWSGDVEAFTLNGDTGAIGTTAVWSAKAKLNATPYANRKIYYRQPNTTTLRAFEWTNLDADGYGTYFSNLCSRTLVAVQCLNDATADEKAKINSGDNLVKFLRGDRTFESASTANGTTRALYRPRAGGVLGDIINGAPAYVGKPPFTYSDAGYSSFVVAKKDRKPMVYVGANDGMLHAFSAGGTDAGTERWAYVPSIVMPEMYRLADTSYESRHRYFVDGAPVIGDIKVGSDWKTILVGGLNKGGRGYYALDITDPESPKALWEFTDANLGLTFGNPVITKRKDGTWVVVFASGYNNGSDGGGGDGKGRLYVVNANTGVKVITGDIPTTAGTASDPSGLAKINTWIDDVSDNTSKRFYGGDLQGNLWRFDVDNLVLPNQGALLLAKFQVNATTPQPITTRPETVEVSGKPVIIVATGRYLGAADVEDTTQQTIYAVKDSLTDTGMGDVRTNIGMVKQTFTVSGNTATITKNPVNWTTNNGWWADLPHTGERVFTNLALQFGVLSVATGIPNGDACSSGGSSWRYFLNATDGSGSLVNAGELWSASSLIAGQSWVKLKDGSTIVVRPTTDGALRGESGGNPPGSGSNPLRTSWRELAD